MSQEDLVRALESNAPRTWTELASRISNGGFHDVWKRLAVSATAALAEELGDEWPGKFIDTNGKPLVATLVAPVFASYIFRLAEIGFQLKLLRGVKGMSKLRADMIGPPTPESWGHSQLVLSLAALEYRRNGDVEVEIDMGPESWAPDVALAGETSRILVECLRMVIGAPAIERLRTERLGRESRMIDEWSRIGRRLVDKSGQAGQGGGWIRCEIDSGIFHDTDWYQHSLGSGSLEEKLNWLAGHLREALEFSSELGGVVLSSIPMHDLPQRPDDACVLEDGCHALLRNLPGARQRETFVVPTSKKGQENVSVWTKLYSDEPTWLDWALSELGLLAL